MSIPTGVRYGKSHWEVISRFVLRYSINCKFPGLPGRIRETVSGKSSLGVRTNLKS